jgi:hypothetical protein
MKSLRTVLAALALCGIAAVAGHAADTGERPFGGPPPPPSRVDERPFGGPPPLKRSIKPDVSGTICKTATETCKLEKAQPAGAACSCPASGGQAVPGQVQ